MWNPKSVLFNYFVFAIFLKKRIFALTIMSEYSDQEVNNDIVHLQVQFLIDLFLI